MRISVEIPDENWELFLAGFLESNPIPLVNNPRGDGVVPQYTAEDYVRLCLENYAQTEFSRGHIRRRELEVVNTPPQLVESAAIAVVEEPVIG